MLIDKVTCYRQPMPGRCWSDAAAARGQAHDYAGAMTHFPEIRAWHVQNAWVSGGFYVHDERNLYCDSSIIGSFQGQNDAERALIAANFAALGPTTRNEHHVAEQVLIFHNEGNSTWGHFLIQTLPKALLFAERFPGGKIAVPVPLTHPGSSYSESFAAYGIGPERLLGVVGDVSYRFGEAVIMDFMYSLEGGLHPAAQELLAPRRPAPGPRRGKPRAIFIRRLPEAARQIVNQAELDLVLERHGVACLAAGELSFARQVAVFQSHDLIIGTLGSDLTNLVFAQPGSRVLALSPDWFEDDFFYKLAISRGVQWNEIRCGELVEPGHHPNWSSFRVDCDLADRVLSILLR